MKSPDPELSSFGGMHEPAFEADASLVALAARLGTTSIATFDERHFRAMQPLTGEPAFTLLPVDA